MIICLYEGSLVVSLPPRGCVYILQTRPLFELAFFLAPACHSAIFPLSVVFFIAEIVANFVVFT
jgi:hypothetical protein